MSIIADTLQRLQTQTKSEVTDTNPPPALVLPARGKREPGWHCRPSPLKFWLVGIGMAIGLSSLGLGTYWIGLHLEFGMPTEASLSPSQHLALSDSSPLLRIQPVDLPFVEATGIPAADPIEESSTPQKSASTKQSSPLNVEHALPTPSVAKTLVSAGPATRSMVPPPDHAEQKTVATPVSTPNQATDLSPKHQIADPKDLPTSLPATFFAQTDQPDSNLVESEAVNETGTPIPLEAAFGKEQISLEELSSTTPQVMENSPLHSNTTALPLKNQKPQQRAQVTDPAQQSPANRLHHGQQLIRTGEYEEAQAILSPLFNDPPVAWEPWFWMGTAYLGAGQLEQADQYFLSGLARNDKVPQLWIQRALVAQQQGSYQLAVHELRQAEALQPDLPHIHLNMGYAYERMGNNRLANQYFGKFLQLTEGEPEFFSIRKKLFARLTSMTKPSVSTTDNPSSLRADR